MPLTAIIATGKRHDIQIVPGGNVNVKVAVRTEDRGLILKESIAGQPKQNRWKEMKDVPAQSRESDAISKDLKRRGFRFAGSTICYAFMQAVGMVNDHLVDCFRHSEVARSFR